MNSIDGKLYIWVARIGGKVSHFCECPPILKDAIGACGVVIDPNEMQHAMNFIHCKRCQRSIDKKVREHAKKPYQCHS